MKLRIFALVLLIYKTLCSYTVENTVSSCINYEANTSYKWCRNSTTFDSGFACSISDYSNVCGGSTSYRCSINNSYLPQNSKKLLCPIDTTSCNSQIMKLETNSSSVSVTSNYFSTGTLCWYRFYPSDNTTKSISVYAKSLFSAKAEVYVESSSNSFSYQGSILFGDSMNVTLNSIVPVWVLVTPSSSNSYVSMTATTSPYYYVSSSSMPVLLIVLISILSFCCCFLFFIIIPMVLCSLCFKKEKNRKQRRAQYIENSTPTTDVNKKV